MARTDTTLAPVAPTGSVGNDVDQLCVNAIRTLSMDAVEAANSGHPGAPMGAAPMAYVLWSRFLRHDPAAPDWVDRDRFILSAGHASMLLYSLLHLSGYPLTLEDLQAFRSWGSRTPGHPEYGHTVGVETTTGPLGQGFATGVGMALAERYLAGRFNRPGASVIDHFTYAIVSDGDLMEGLSSEAASLAGHLRLGKLVYLYDDNEISIDGPTDLAFTEDVAARFEAYGWHVQRVTDGNDLDAISEAIGAARIDERPSLIAVRTHIGFGAPTKQDTAAAHGAPLGADEVAAAKRAYGWPEDDRFWVPDEVRAAFAATAEAGADAHAAWRDDLERYRASHPDEAQELERMLAGELPSGWDEDLPRYGAGEKIATRSASGDAIAAIAGTLPELLGGSADLTPSNNTEITGDGVFRPGAAGRYIHFGVREHAMGAALNGMALHGGVRPYGGTFLIFSDYMRPAIRLAALMDAGSIFVFTHDSIGLGEDGPTHQPVEHLASLRAMPNLTVIRPADANETVEAWRYALAGTRGPVALCLSRQSLPVLEVTASQPPPVARGAYIVKGGADAEPDVILIASGSEVSLAVAAADELARDGTTARVVSMPSWELFAQQNQDYRDRILPPSVPARVAVEAAASLGWCRWVGDAGEVLGLDRFGASAPGGTVMDHLGFNTANVVRLVQSVLRRVARDASDRGGDRR